MHSYTPRGLLRTWVSNCFPNTQENAKTKRDSFRWSQVVTLHAEVKHSDPTAEEKMVFPAGDTHFSWFCFSGDFGHFGPLEKAFLGNMFYFFWA